MRKIIINMILIFISITFLGVFVLLIFDNVNLRNEITELESEQSNGECTFIKTLRVIDILDYEGAVPEDKFLLVDSFQSFNPFVLRVDISDINNIQEGLFYEFTFKGLKEMYTINDSSLSNFEILSIIETNKEGFLQIQEACR